MSHLVLILLTVVALALGARAWQPDYILRVTEGWSAPDCTPRWSTLINGTSPGPAIHLTEGQHVWIRVYNDLKTDNFTMHWHGLTQFGTPFSDGTPLASQWPIPAGRYFDYEIQLERGFSGTYFYHSHVGAQAFSAHGALIIHEADDSDIEIPVEYDEEIIMLLGDAYHKDDHQIVAGLMNTTAFGWTGEASYVLVNGNAYGACNSSTIPPGTTCGNTCGWNNQAIEAGKTYRVRIIGATGLSHVALALEGHQMTLFEADGTYLEPLNITNLQIHTGQRYSVLIKALEATDARLQARPYFWWNLETRWRPMRTYGAAKWAYYANPQPIVSVPIPTDLRSGLVPLPNETFGWVDSQIAPYKPTSSPPAYDEVTRTIILDGQQLRKNKGFRWVVNNVSLYGEDSLPQRPFLVDYYLASGTRAPDYATAFMNGGRDPTTNTYPAKLGETLDIVFQNLAGPTGVVEAHPWHSHGSKYWDMGFGPGNFSYDALDAYTASASGSPFQRDTSIVYSGPGASYLPGNTSVAAPGGWRLVRIKVENPGAWMVHCHIIQHAIMGMQTLFLYGMEDLPPLPQEFVAEYTQFKGPAYPASNSSHIPVSYFAPRDSHR